MNLVINYSEIPEDESLDDKHDTKNFAQSIDLREIHEEVDQSHSDPHDREHPIDNAVSLRVIDKENV